MSNKVLIILSLSFFLLFQSTAQNVFINTTPNNFEKFLEIQFKNHNENIFMVNAWNEWGENMAIEPGKMNGTKYLQLLKSNLLSFIVD